ncbi:STAS domain-containing protein [Rhodanobacter sp. C03]|uniref:STAS domain-containing protein n=1 Tax=Rhodanobacter sp. C03 TaxID=1945858 RepID=UPI0009840D67|nr:STAS domain-containing protein [Rhodanobacter sp. C03]OOG59610.1 sulfate transporter [Rhodanobacter sp. C03]
MTTGAESGFRLQTATPGTLGVDGVLDFDTAAPALQAIQSALATGQLAWLDLADVSRSDSAGLACVLAVVAEAARQGRRLQVVHMPVGMQALATVCEVEQLLS